MLSAGVGVAASSSVTVTLSSYRPSEMSQRRLAAGPTFLAIEAFCLYGVDRSNGRYLGYLSCRCIGTSEALMYKWATRRPSDRSVAQWRHLSRGRAVGVSATRQNDVSRLRVYWLRSQGG